MSLHDQPHDQQIAHDPKRPYSIDLTLELERQLEDESLPCTPAANLDPQILASIITSTTKERDSALKQLSEAHAREAQLRDGLRDVTEKCANVVLELEEARKRMKDDEDAISMLRTKVEESRRGLMRLQTENRRTSQGPATADMARGGMPFGGGPVSNKRASSFTPLAGSGAPRQNSHRRISSVSDSGLVFADQSLLSAGSSAQSFLNPDASSQHPPISTRRFSGLFTARGMPADDAPDPVAAELASARRALHTAKMELEEMAHELGESNDARQASEACAQALREFIAEHNVGVGPVCVDAEPPARTTGEETAKPGTGWGFKLWKVDAAAPAVSAEPLSRKLGGFFSSRSSISSTTPSSHRPPLSSSYGQEPMYNASDTSSVSEPISPTHEGSSINVNIMTSPPLSPGVEPVKICT